MKKALFILLFLGCASSAFATYGTGTVTLGGTDTLDVSTSNQVYLDYAQQGDGDTFAVSTYHDKGDRTYASSSEDANIYWDDGTGIDVPTAPAVGSSMDATDYANTL